MAEFTTNFKAPRVSQKVRTKLKRLERDGTENRNKALVRRRDNRLRKGCAFPLCGCKKFGLAKHVAHLDHKGMGGNKAEDRSVPEKMIQVCIARHREHLFSIDKGTLQCRPLTAAGTNGPVSWWIDAETLIDWRLREHGILIAAKPIDEWVELAREVSPGQFWPFTSAQLGVLDALAEMQS